jgi:precorrin-8X/cobalt-precorrin-8 methylmutase
VTPLFDGYVAVDWSASSTPKTGRDSIWYCVLGEQPRNPATRAQATAELRRILRARAAEGRKVLVGFDFPYGYPCGFAEFAAPGGGPPWRRVWDLLSALVVDDDRNRNNRFEVAARLNRGAGAFWGCPASHECDTLTAKRTMSFPAHGLAELRGVERRTRGVQSVWKLGGAGSVGSQTLLGIPRVASLRDDPQLAPASAVWPFESGFVVPEATIVHVEIWPRLAPPAAHPVRDAAQVAGVVEHWRRLDAAGTLATLFTPPAAPPCARDEEGWIFG